MTGIELVRKHFPNATDDFADYVLWNRTGFPSFFDSDIGAEKYFENQIIEFKKLLDAGKTPCDLCNSEAVKNGLCQKCFDLLKPAQENKKCP